MRGNTGERKKNTPIDPMPMGAIHGDIMTEAPFLMSRINSCKLDAKKKKASTDQGGDQ